LSWDSSSVGAAAYKPEVIAYCGAQGVQILDEPLYFSQTAVDLHALVQKLIEAGANIIYTNSLGTGPALIAKALVEMQSQDLVALCAFHRGLDATVGLLGQTTLRPDGLPSTTGLIG